MYSVVRAQGEQIALDMLEEHRRQWMIRTFTGTRIVFSKGNYVKGNVHGLAVGGRDFHLAMADKAPSAAGPEIKSAVEGFIAEMTGAGDAASLNAALGSEAVAELGKQIFPIYSLVYSTVKWGQITKKMMTEAKFMVDSRAVGFRDGFRPGEPQAALDAVHSIVKQELTFSALDFSNQSVGLGTKYAGLFVDLGFATNVGSSVATFVADYLLKLAVIGRDIRMMKSGNVHLQSPATLSIKVFKDCPLLGCYLLCSTTTSTSDVVNLLVGEIGAPGWRDKVNAMQESSIAPTMKMARKVIESSNLQLDGVNVLSQPSYTHRSKHFLLNAKAKVADAMSGLRPHRSTAGAA